MNLLKSMGPIKYVLLGAIVIVVAVLGFNAKKSGDEARKAAEEAERLANLDAATLVDEFVKDELPPMGTITLTTNYKGVPFAMETSTLTMSNVTYMTGRSAVDPKNNAFNETVEQYIEQIGNISTFYTMNPHADTYDGDYIKETLAETKEEQGFKPFVYLPKDLEELTLNDVSKEVTCSSYIMEGILPADKFPKYFYNIFGTVECECKVTIAVDKNYGYITGIQLEGTQESGELTDFLFVENFRMPSKDEQQASVAVPDNVRSGNAEEGCLLYYIKDEAANAVKEND